MRKIISRFVKVLIKIGLIQAVYQLTYKGRGVSVNDYYSSKGWWYRNKIKQEYSAIFSKIIAEGVIEWMDEYCLIIFYNSNHDPDNVVGLSKIFVDEIKQDTNKEGDIVKRGYIKDDSAKYCKFFAVIPDRDLEKNTFEFKLLKIK